MSTKRVIIAVDQSASLDTSGDGKNQIGFCIFVDKDIVEHGEFLPDYPHFDGCRRWLEDMVIKYDPTDSHRNNVILAIETVWFGKNVRVFQRLISIKEQLHAKARELGIGYEEVSPLQSYQAAVGRSRYLGTGTRKKEIQDALKVKRPSLNGASEHVYDAAGIGEAIIKRGI